MANSTHMSGRAEVRGAILLRLEVLYDRALEKDNLSLCVRILDMMAKLNGLYDQRRKSLVPGEMTLDDLTEDHLSQLLEEAEALEKMYEKKCVMPHPMMKKAPQKGQKRPSCSQLPKGTQSKCFD